MKSMFARLAATAFAVVSLATAAQAEDKVVNIYNWSDYIDDSILTDFTKETGIKVVYDTFDQNETLETKLLAGKTGYDIVVPTAYFLQRQIKAGVFQKLDKSKLPNISNMWDTVQQRIATYDPGNQYAIEFQSLVQSRYNNAKQSCQYGAQYAGNKNAGRVSRSRSQAVSNDGKWNQG